MRISDWSSDVCSSDLAEVASIGGMVRQYQIIVDPQKLAAFGVTAPEVADALKRANQESGGGSLELAEAEYNVRASGYLKSLDDFRAVPLRTADRKRTRLNSSHQRTSRMPSSVRK